jgi:hypothetical protein
VRMTVEDRDQWQCLLADWSAAYHIPSSDDETDEQPFKAAPHADPETLLEAASPRELRAVIREDHTRRTTAAETPQPAAPAPARQAAP